MDIPRKIGIMIYTAVPAIIGGGIVYDLFQHSWPAVIVFEILLIMAALGLIRN